MPVVNVLSTLQWNCRCDSCSWMYASAVWSIITTVGRILLFNVCEGGGVECGERTMGADGGRRGGIKTTADSNFTHYHFIACTAWSASPGMFNSVSFSNNSVCKFNMNHFSVVWTFSAFWSGWLERDVARKELYRLSPKVFFPEHEWMNTTISANAGGICTTMPDAQTNVVQYTELEVECDQQPAMLTVNRTCHVCGAATGWCCIQWTDCCRCLSHFLKSRVWCRVPRGSTLISGDTKTQYRETCMQKISLICADFSYTIPACDSDS